MQPSHIMLRDYYENRLTPRFLLGNWHEACYPEPYDTINMFNHLFMQRDVIWHEGGQITFYDYAFTSCVGILLSLLLIWTC